MIGRVDPYTALTVVAVLGLWGLSVVIAAVFASERKRQQVLVAGSSLPPTGGPASSPVADAGSSVGAPAANRPAVGAPKNAGGEP